MAKLDYERHGIYEAQGLIRERRDLTVRSPSPRPEGPRDAHFDILMKKYAVPELNAGARPFSCIIFWPRLSDPEKQEDPLETFLKGIVIDKSRRPVLRTVWEFFMGPSDQQKRVIQLCADPTPEGGPGRNLCMNIHHLALVPNRQWNSLPRPMPEEAVYQLLVLNRPAEIVADDLGCSTVDVRAWVDHLDGEKVEQFRAEGFRYSRELLRKICIGMGRTELDELNAISERARELRQDKDARYRIRYRTTIPDQFKYLPSHWDGGDVDPDLELDPYLHSRLTQFERRRKIRYPSGLLIGKPASKPDEKL